MAKRNVSVAGLDTIKSNITRIKAQVKMAAETAIRERTDEMHSELLSAVTGSGSIVGTDPHEGGGHPGTGIDVPGSKLVPGMISIVSGRLRSALSQSVTSNKNRVSGSIGFPKGYRSLGGASGNAIDWPNKPPIVNVVESRRSSDKAPRKLRPSNMPPQKYVPSVLLGTDKMLGRNVLRLALYEDIVEGRTKAKVAARIAGALK